MTDPMTDDEVTAALAEETGDPVDIDAPWGRKADGSPRDKPGRKPGQRTGTGRRRPAAAGKVPTPPRAAPPRKPARKGTDYATPLTGVFQLAAAPLGMLGARNPVLLADAATLNAYGPGVAGALSDLANERPEVAAVLDKILSAGPYGALLAAVFPMAFQVLANHKVVPAGMLGTVSAEDLIGAAAPPERQAA